MKLIILDSKKKIDAELANIGYYRDYTVVDTETVSKTEEKEDAKNPLKAKLVDIQVLGVDDRILIFSADYADSLLKINPKTTIVGQNFKYDLKVLHKHGVDLTNYRWHDTMILDHLIDENRSHSLSKMISVYFGQNSYKDDFWDKYEQYTDAPLRERYEYGARDIMWTNKIYLKQMELLSEYY